jgi:hypothetical protein
LRGRRWWWSIGVTSNWGLRRWIGLLVLRVRICVWRIARIGRLDWRRRRRLLLFGPQYELCGNLGIQVLVIVEADAATSRTVEYPQGDLAGRRPTCVELDHPVDALDDEPLQNAIPRETRVEIHVVGFEATLIKGALNPADKVSLHFLEEDQLDIGNLVSVPLRDIKGGLWRTASAWAGASTSVGFLPVSARPWGPRPGPRASIAVVRPTVVTTVPAACVAIVTPRRRRTAWSIVVSSPALVPVPAVVAVHSAAS